MGRYILKVPDRDLYVEWSSIVEAPLMWGTREEFLEDFEEERLDRADALGSSRLWTAKPNEGEIYMQKGWLPMERLGAFMDIHTEQYVAGVFDDDDPRLLALLDPFED